MSVLYLAIKEFNEVPCHCCRQTSKLQQLLTVFSVRAYTGCVCDTSSVCHFSRDPQTFTTNTQFFYFCWMSESGTETK